MNDLLAGVARINITPPAGIRMAGYGIRVQPSRGVHDDLWAQALILDDGDQPITVTCVDTLDLPADLLNEVRGKLEREIGLPASNSFLCASHTHSGPDLAAENELSAAYRSELSERLYQVIRMAMQNRRKANLWCAKGSLQEIARNRRPSGGPMDPEVGVVGIETVAGELMAILVNYTCHATVLGADNLLISADYPGYLRRGIEQQLNPDIITLFANGAEGNINPGGYSPEMSMIGHYIPHRTFADAERLGTALAQEVLNILDQPRSITPAIVKSLTTLLELPQKNKTSREQLETNLAEQQRTVAMLKEAGAKPEACETAAIDLAYAVIHLSYLETLEREGMTTLAEIQAVRIGEAYLVGIPGEAFVEIGLEIKQRSGLPIVLVIGLANGYVGYIPTEEAYTTGGYEPAVARVGPGAGAKIRNAALALLERLKSE